MKIKSFLTVVFVFFFSAWAYGSVLTAEVEAWNKVKLSGDLYGTETSSFLNTNHSKGSVRKGDTARLEIRELKKCYIKNVCVWIKSNKNSGAGNLDIKVGNQTILSRNGNFNNWEGNNSYSTEHIPFSCDGNWLITSEESISLTIIGTTNSLQLSKLVVTYEETAPEAFCTQFAVANSSIEVCEETPESGITLPTLINEKLNIIGDWELVGWSETEINDIASTKPEYHNLYHKYYPQKNLTLYPVYKFSNELQIIGIDSMRQDGEYILAMQYYDKSFIMLNGAVSGRYIYTSVCNIEFDEDSIAYLYATSIPDENRYRLEFDNDSVSIYNVATSKSIGYSSSGLQSNMRKWKVIEQGHHTVFLCCEDKYNGTGKGLNYKVDAKDEDGNYIDVFYISTMTYNINSDFVLLFDVTDLPRTEKVAQYTTHPEIHSSLYTPEQDKYPTKLFINGKLYIQQDNNVYDCLGHKIK